MDRPRHRLAVVVPALAAAILIAGIDGIYLAIIRSQPSDGTDSSRVMFVATHIAMLSISAIAGGTFPAHWSRTFALGASFIGSLALLVLAGFSIGLLFTPSVILLIWAATREIRWTTFSDVITFVTGAAIALLVLALGLGNTQ